MFTGFFLLVNNVTLLALSTWKVYILFFYFLYFTHQTKSMCIGSFVFLQFAKILVVYFRTDTVL